MSLAKKSRPHLDLPLLASPPKKKMGEEGTKTGGGRKKFPAAGRRAAGKVRGGGPRGPFYTETPTGLEKDAANSKKSR
jgi:hypothetical protein